MLAAMACAARLFRRYQQISWHKCQQGLLCSDLRPMLLLTSNPFLPPSPSCALNKEMASNHFDCPAAFTDSPNYYGHLIKSLYEQTDGQQSL